MSTVFHKPIIGLSLAVLLPFIAGCPAQEFHKPTDSNPESRDSNRTTSHEVKPLLDLLAQLPKDRWPTDETDTLRFAQAGTWYQDHIVGRRARWLGAPAGELEFTADGKGTFRATLGIGRLFRCPKLKLFGREWSSNIGTDRAWTEADTAYFAIEGLSEQAAEQVRQSPKDKLLELTFDIRSVAMTTTSNAKPGVVVVYVDKVSIAGIGP